MGTVEMRIMIPRILHLQDQTQIDILEDRRRLSQATAECLLWKFYTDIPSCLCSPSGCVRSA